MSRFSDGYRYRCCLLTRHQHHQRIHDRAALQQQGNPISGNDLFIAANASPLGITLVMNNMREFVPYPLKIPINESREQANT
jgi:predicted nucleic acid-binding protein